MDLVRDLLPVLDDFERALKVETADRNYAKGIELIYQRLFDTLKKLGLEPMEPRASASIRTFTRPWSACRPKTRKTSHAGRIPERL